MFSHQTTHFVTHGAAGIVRGATAAFFGFLGYDQVCSMAGESQNPKRNLPIAILATLGIVAVFVHMTIGDARVDGDGGVRQHFDRGGFPDGLCTTRQCFRESNYGHWGIGHTIPIVVLVTTMAQPRLMYALAEDDLLQQWFRQIHGGNLWNGTLVAGSIMTIISSFRLLHVVHHQTGRCSAAIVCCG